ncbi:MAG: hypothetical protein ACLQVL_26945 [Terriglobia bacterium]
MGVYNFFENVARNRGVQVAVVPDHSAAVKWLAKSYTYDAAGNRLTKTAVEEASPNPVSVLSQYSG